MSIEEYLKTFQFDNIDTLQKRLNTSWQHIAKARELARMKVSKLSKMLQPYPSEDTSIVVFGSLARGEITQASDLDWTLLIDGQADSKHADVAYQIATSLRKGKLKQPGQERVFGTTVFSHDIIHQIGGEEDTNRNITRRILLLLESRTLGRSDAYQRVIRQVLLRYLKEDRGLWDPEKKYRVPRFLLNDIVRYWRTVAVDFAYKRRERAGQGMALRSLKLGMSRKLIFLSGLLTCFSIELDLKPEQRASIFALSRSTDLIAHLTSFIQQTPLQILAHATLEYDPDGSFSRRLFDAYDRFLALLNDEEKREHLGKLREEDFQNDKVFSEARHIRHEFRDAVQGLFLERESNLCRLTREYGVF
jgi:predicted nucleotidyltransferase